MSYMQSGVCGYDRKWIFKYWAAGVGAISSSRVHHLFISLRLQSGFKYHNFLTVFSLIRRIIFSAIAFLQLPAPRLPGGAGRVFKSFTFFLSRVPKLMCACLISLQPPPVDGESTEIQQIAMTRQLSFFDSMSTSWHQKNNNTAHLKGGLWSWGRRGIWKGAWNGIWHIFIPRREGAGWRSLQHSQARADASHKRALASQSASYHKICSHAERAENARPLATAFHVFGVWVTPGNRGRRFGRFGPGEERQQRSLLRGAVQTEMTSAWDTSNDLLV